MSLIIVKHNQASKYEKFNCGIFNEAVDVFEKGNTKNYSSESSSYLILKNVSGHLFECGANQHTCMDGSCIIQHQLCARNNFCDPHLCKCKLSNATIPHLDFCAKRCAAPICKCPLLTFQCTTGGCVPYSFVCDGATNCRDASDELCLDINDYVISITISDIISIKAEISGNNLCLGFRCSDGLCIHSYLVNDLIPDCSLAEDEDHSIEIKYRDTKYTCQTKLDMPCAPNHSTCFKFYQLCVYDINVFGQAAYCRDAAHIRDCDDVQCTNTFKCPNSYCIPFRRVCDGVRDCIGGEEEIRCLHHICKGLLKCIDSTICIPPFEVCDGIRHCPHGDDEQLCDITFCPQRCECVGYSTICRDNAITNIPLMGTDHIKYLSLGYDIMYVPDFTNLTSQSRMIMLNMSHSVIEDICPSFKLACEFYNTLLILLINHNSIARLSSVCFDSLTSLSLLNLENNPLSLIAKGAFRGVPLGVLNMQGTRINAISEWASDLKRLRILNIRTLKIKSIHEEVTDILNNVDVILTFDARICCLMSRSKTCQQITIYSASCLRIISKGSITFILIVIGGWSTAFSLFSMAANIMLHISRKPALCFLVSMHILGNLLSCIYFTVIAIMDLRYGSQYVLIGETWVESIPCHVLTLFLFTGIAISNFSSLVLSQYIFDTVSSMVPLGKTYSIGSIWSILVGVILSTVVFSILQIYRWWLVRSDASHGLCMLVNSAFAENVYTLIPVIILTTLVMATFIHSVIISVFIINKASSAGKSVSKLSSLPQMSGSPMIQLIKHTVQSMVFKAITTLPIPCTAIFYLMEESLPDDIGLLMFAMSAFVGCYYESVVYIWLPFIKKRGLQRCY